MREASAANVSGLGRPRPIAQDVSVTNTGNVKKRSVTAAAVPYRKPEKKNTASTP